MSAIVLKSYYANESTPDASGAFINISGRPPGLVGWFLVAIGVSPVTTFRVDSKSVTLTDASILGGGSHVVPLPKVSSVTSGYSFPFIAAFAVFVFVTAVASILLYGALSWSVRDAIAFPAGLLLGLAAAATYYLLNRQLTLGITEVGGRSFAIRFKASLIEGQQVDVKRAAEARALLQTLVEQVN
jgi:hypothetical protein